MARKFLYDLKEMVYFYLNQNSIRLSRFQYTFQLLVLTLGLLPSVVCGQDKTTERPHTASLYSVSDSILQVIGQSKGREKGEAWLAYGLHLADRRSDSAFLALDSAIALFSRLDLEDRMVYATGEKLMLHSLKTENKEANFLANLIENKLDLIDSLSFRGKLKVVIGNVKNSLGKVESGLSFMQAAMEDLRQIGDTGGVIRVLESMARLSWQDQSLEQAFVYLDSSITLARAWGGAEKTTLLRLYNNAGTCLLAMGETRQAKSYIQNGITVAKIAGESNDLLFLYFTLAEINVGENELDSAKANFNLAGEMVYDEKAHSSQALAMEANSMAKALEYQFDSSDYWLKQCYLALDTSEIASQKLSIMVLRSDIFAALGEHERALKAFKEVDRLRKAWYTEEKARGLQEVRIEYETKRSEEENAQLRELNATIRSENRRNTRFFLTIIALIFVMVCLMAFFLLRLGKLNKKVRLKQEELIGQNGQLRELTEENELLAGIVAHDLKAPLSKIEGLMGMVSAEGGLSDSQLAAFGMMSNVLEGGKNLVTDILILSEAGQGRTPTLKRHELQSILTSIQDQFRDSASRKQITLQLNPPPQPVEALVHPPYLTRVLDNLISNAIKFSRKGTTVNIRWGMDEKGAWCSVADQGPGIKASEAPKLFKRFSKLSNRPTGGESSSGLGLYIVKVLLDTTQSEISVQTQEGKGTTFTIRFPQG